MADADAAVSELDSERVSLCRRRLRTCRCGLQNCWPGWSNWIMVLLRSCHPVRRWRSSLDGWLRGHEVAQAVTAKTPKGRLAGPDAVRLGRARSLQEFQHRSCRFEFNRPTHVVVKPPKGLCAFTVPLCLLGAFVVNGPVVAQMDIPRPAPKPNPFPPGRAVYDQEQ